MKTPIVIALGGSSLVLLVAGIVLAIIQLLDNRRISAIWKALENEASVDVFSPEMVAELPEPAQRYLIHAIEPGTPIASHVNLTMTGRMRSKADAGWWNLKATEVIASQRGFVWKADVSMGIAPVNASDYYLDGNGRVRVSLLGLIPVINADGPDISKSALGRLAAEFIWLPSALLPQNGVTWEAVDENRVNASFTLDGEPVTLMLTVSEDGALREFTIQRYGNMTDDGSYQYIPFGGVFDAEKSFGGYTIPSRMRVGWWYGTERYYDSFQFTIEDAKFGNEGQF